jgi:uncharacterized membrane protein YphA (DoxX/SURF4 family)
VATRSVPEPTELTATRQRAAVGKLEILLSIVFVVAGAAKLLGFPFMVAVFQAVGAGSWFRYAVACAEIAGGLALLTPSFVGIAALALVPLMLGAAMTEFVFLSRPPIAALVCLAALCRVAWRHRPRARDAGASR